VGGGHGRESLRTDYPLDLIGFLSENDMGVVELIERPRRAAIVSEILSDGGLVLHSVGVRLFLVWGSHGPLLQAIDLF
jgi:hypothetical protein